MCCVGWVVGVLWEEGVLCEVGGGWWVCCVGWEEDVRWVVGVLCGGCRGWLVSTTGGSRVGVHLVEGEDSCLDPSLSEHMAFQDEL